MKVHCGPAAMSVSSDDVRRLLRALGNPVALARDPLAVRLVERGDGDSAALRERADRVLAILRASLASMCSQARAHRSNDRMRRAASIIEQCDLAGRPHDSVSGEIGLARRQFYRDRALAIDALALELDDLVRAKPVSAPAALDATQLGFDVAEALVGIGRFDEVDALLERIAASAGTNNRFRACARLVEAACESGERARTQRAIERARSLTASCEPAAFLPRARYDLALMLAEDILAGPEAKDRRGPLLDRLRSCIDSTDERWENLAVGLTQHASAANTRGDFAMSLACLHEADAVVRRCERSPVTLSALIPNYLGVTLMMMPRSLEAASEQHKLAVAIGRARGLVRIVIASTLNDYAIALWTGRAALVFERWKRSKRRAT